MTKLDQLDAVMQRQNGILRTADIRALGVSRSYFAEYVKVRGLERVAHGVYLSPDSLGDDFFYYPVQVAAGCVLPRSCPLSMGAGRA